MRAEQHTQTEASGEGKNQRECKRAAGLREMPEKIRLRSEQRELFDGSEGRCERMFPGDQAQPSPQDAEPEDQIQGIERAPTASAGKDQFPFQTIALHAYALARRR